MWRKRTAQFTASPPGPGPPALSSWKTCSWTRPIWDAVLPPPSSAASSRSCGRGGQNAWRSRPILTRWVFTAPSASSTAASRKRTSAPRLAWCLCSPERVGIIRSRYRATGSMMVRPAPERCKQKDPFDQMRDRQRAAQSASFTAGMPLLHRLVGEVLSLPQGLNPFPATQQSRGFGRLDCTSSANCYCDTGSRRVVRRLINYEHVILAERIATCHDVNPNRLQGWPNHLDPVVR